MATNTKQARRIAQTRRELYVSNYDAYFSNLFHNSVIVEGLPDNLPKRYLLDQLFEKGGIALDIQTGLYLPYTKEGVDIYGLPTNYTLVGFNGFVIRRLPEEVVILRANDRAYPPKCFIDGQIEKLADFDTAIEQNLDAIRTMTVVSVPDRATLLTFGNLAETRQVGSTLAVVNKQAIQGGEFNSFSTGATYLVDKLQNAREKVMNETLQHLGISTVNTAKAERVQTEEVTTAQGQAIENIQTLIDTFNQCAEKGGLTIRLRANTSLMEDRELLKQEKVQSNDRTSDNNID